MISMFITIVIINVISLVLLSVVLPQPALAGVGGAGHGLITKLVK